MENMKEFDELKKLERLQRVEAPPFLLTRINERIRSAQSNNAPLQWSLAASLVFSFLLMANVYMLSSTGQTTTNTSLEQTIDNLDLMPSNQLYYE